MKDTEKPVGLGSRMIDEAVVHIDPKTGKLTIKHMEECTGCALCEGDR